MKKNSFVALFTPLLFLFLALPFTLPAQLVYTYQESDDIIANPERGLQKYSITNSSYYTNTDYSNITVSSIAGWRTGPEKVTVIYRYFLLGDYMETEISENYLDNIQIDFDRIREAGLKCLVRFSYTNRQSSDPQQPVKELILQHIEQLAPILEKNKDVIVAHQAGFIGTWGEWYYTNSAEFGTDGSISAAQWENRKEVVDAMLTATPLDIPVQVRYPQVKITMYGSTPLTEETAYTDTPQARIGFYNDAFLNVWGDMGTYRNAGQHGNPSGTSDYSFLANETRYLPMSGETNGLNPPRTDGENALLEMDMTNWSIINRDYHGDVINGWINTGHLETMLKYLGYRFVLRQATFAQAEEGFEVTLDIENTGYARPFRERKAWLIVRNLFTSDEQAYEVPGDVRTWEDEVRVVIPVDATLLPDGLYEVHLHMPDLLLEDRPEYAIRLANDQVWDSEKGTNFLGIIEIADSGLEVSAESEETYHPDGIRLHQNYANPFNPATTVRFELDQQGPVRLTVHDLAGRLVTVLKDGHFPAGEHHAVWNASDVSSGVYVIRLSAGGGTRSILASLIK
ncbi:DUF4874 domain-containing protein [Balneolales bacterium ANBcel1]|nr:DUF4874 domain-containing protein [Balneolales bacterium ANBcel1]